MSQTAKSNFRGLLIEEMFQKERVKIGPHVAKEIMDNHTIIVIDLGVIVHASCVAITKKADQDYTCTPFKFSSEDFYTKSGVDSFCQSLETQSVTDFQEDIIQLSECHGRTQDIDGFSSHIEAFKKISGRLINRSFSTEALKNRFYLHNRKRSYWDCQVEMIKEFTRQSGKGAILVIGKPTFKSSIKGKKSSCPKKTIEFLRRFFVVVVLKHIFIEKSRQIIIPFYLKMLNLI